MNNQVFRHIAQRPQYFLDCKNHLGQKEFRLVGDAYGNKAESKWNINAGGFSKGGGPFQWFHRYTALYTYIRDPVGSTDQADPSCFYFRIS